jgi:hypothetical protein
MLNHNFITTIAVEERDVINLYVLKMHDIALVLSFPSRATI